MGRTTVNLIGNCVATVVIARWENEFNYDKMKIFINGEESDSEPKQICEVNTNTEG
jgi:Na+/H+-dicarboxylate symporter